MKGLGLCGFGRKCSVVGVFRHRGVHVRFQFIVIMIMSGPFTDLVRVVAVCIAATKKGAARRSL